MLQLFSYSLVLVGVFFADGLNQQRVYVYKSSNSSFQLLVMGNKPVFTLILAVRSNHTWKC